MKIAITDANIFIDLYELGRLDRPIFGIIYQKKIDNTKYSSVFGVKYLSCSK
ncbi:MAG: hypothetical protein RIR11_3287 [Bacteroidota bacterium]|jgi:hypothetical protein